jgi:phosphate starvation-inducible protein PhoH
MDKQDELIITDAKYLADNIIIKKATLKQYCDKCKRIHIHFCLGGIVFGKNLLDSL